MELLCRPIGTIRTEKKVKFDTPHQPEKGWEDASGGAPCEKKGGEERNVIHLFPGHRFEEGLKDLHGFERVWLLWWFHKHSNWRPLVMPPRGPSIRRGVFATRSPHRPNPIGITAVPLLDVGSDHIVVGKVDLLDDTPILDIKPYISEVDSFPDQRSGWLEQDQHLFEKSPTFHVTLAPLAQAQVKWLSVNWKIQFLPKVESVLQRSPYRSRTYRITAPKNGEARISSGVWRAYFCVRGQEVEIVRISPGYPKTLLYEEGYTIITDWEAQRAFYKQFA
jgi:tRNA-Thr(GGU) m(6)t(6)A37 methyltransferase TsaA